MWLMLNDCFLSIVSKECARDELLVRARRAGDIEKIFPGAIVTRSTTTDYLFRTRVKRTDVEAAMIVEVRRINYANFKGSVPPGPLHDAYLRCWNAMADLQPSRPYTGLPRTVSYSVGRGSGSGGNGAAGGDVSFGYQPALDLGTIDYRTKDQPKKRRRKKRRSIKRGR